jgi:hypothetical protein
MLKAKFFCSESGPVEISSYKFEKPINDNVQYSQTDNIIDWVDYLKEFQDLPSYFGLSDIKIREEFKDAVKALGEEYRRKQAISALPERPAREYRPRESIIDYLRAPDGFGPWLDAGALTRPLLRELSPKAYMALANWLRTNDLPADLYIPTKSDVVTARLEAVAGGPVAAEKRALAASLERGLRNTIQ